uniref:Transmembrane protein n=1 Tax=Pithovirus LCPAC102 TaxID=2506587 RepID=A0A481Z341_9VIRU|nr:MAG: hypothetical protein LCPAC102_02210 [Pithovirus LCPAC102]
MTGDICKVECNKEENSSWCDVAAGNFCKNVSSDDIFCGCINSSNGPELKCIDPVCDPDSGSYITASTRGFINACLGGGVTVCKSVFNCQSTGSCEFSIDKINQYCGNGKGSNPPVGPGTTGTANERSGKNNIPTSTIAGIIVFIVIIIILIIIIIVYSSGEEEVGDNNNST